MKTRRKQIQKAKRISAYLHQRDWDEVCKKISNSTCQGVSEYVRNLLLGVPITYYTRNKSFDDFVSEGVRIRREIQHIRSDLQLSQESQARLIQLFIEINDQLKILSDHVYKNNNKQKHRS